MTCIPVHPDPAPLQQLYRWFSAVSNQEMAVLAEMLTPALDIDVLHPLRHTTALMEATRLGRTKAANWLLEQGAAPGLLCGVRPSSPLHAAIRCSHAALTKAMLDKMEHLSCIDHGGRTPLHMLVQYADRAQEKLWLKIATDMVEKTPRLDALDSEGITVLHYALIHEWPDLVELLLEHGANPNALAIDTGVSPVLMAALNQQHHVVRMLLKYGANPYIPSSDGQTALAVMPGIARMVDDTQHARDITTVPEFPNRPAPRDPNRRLN